MSTLKVSSADDLCHKSLDHIGFCIGPRILPVQGILCIAGEPGCGKSYITMDICISMILGQQLFKDTTYNFIFADKPRSVLYLDKEMGEFTMKERFNEFMFPDPDDAYHESIRKQFHFISCPPMMTLASHVDDIIKAVKSVQADIVVLDPFRMFHTGEENDSNTMSTVFKYLRRISLDTGCSFIIDHHLNKPFRSTKDDNPNYSLINRLRGSTVLGAEIDAGFIVGQNTDSEYSIQFFKVRHATGKGIKTIRILDRHNQGHCALTNCGMQHPVSYFQIRLTGTNHGAPDKAE